MSDFHIFLLLIICISCVLIFLLLAVKIVYICKTFEQFKKENNANLFNVASQVRKQDAQDIALLTEVRRTNRLLADLYRRMQGKHPSQDSEVVFMPGESEDSAIES
jgi:hypothetical protein